VLTDLIVAPLADATAVAETGAKDRVWPWVDVKGFDISDLAAIQCLMEGLDPSEPVTPPEWRNNPFMKTKMAVTVLVRMMDAFIRPCRVLRSTGDSVAALVVLDVLNRLADATAAPVASISHSDSTTTASATIARAARDGRAST